MRILVADKDPELRAIVRTRLSARNYEVVEASKSAEVLRALARQPVDLILVSNDMERIAGLRLVEQIRKQPHWTAVPILLMTEESQVSELIMSHERGFDDFLVKPFNPLVLQLRVALNISRSRQRIEANALTHLPGNASIERVINQKIESKTKFSVLYIDINHFKSFNDRYGFEKGDDVLRQTSRILMRVAQEIDPSGSCFVGHIGGDDYIVVTPIDFEEPFARAFIAEFDRIMPTYYNEADQKRGFIRVTNRKGKQATFPLMSCAVAACNNLYRQYASMGEIAQDAAELKGFLKSQPGSHYLRDRRSSPVQAFAEALEILAPEMEPEKSQEDMGPLGQVLVGAGLITEDQLSLALKKHIETGRHLGQVLISMNAVSSEDVGRTLEKKLRVPYVSLKDLHLPSDLLQLFTPEFIKSHRVLPLEVNEQDLRLGMCNPFDLKTIDSIERITGLKPVPCLALEDEFEDFLDRSDFEESEDERTGTNL